VPRRVRLPLLVGFLVLAADWVLKALAWRLLRVPPRPHELLPSVLTLQYVENRGLAFGLGEGSDRLAWWLPLLRVGAAAPLLVLWSWVRTEDLRARVLIALGIAGFVGNALSQLQTGFVVDFLVLSAFGRGAVAVNVADLAIFSALVGLGRHLTRVGLPSSLELALSRLRSPRR
jgi:signal peptidase II